jgi:hypothetical protein
LVEPRHGQAAGGFENIGPVWVVALHAIHLAFDDGMMLRQAEFRVRFQVAVKASRGVRAGIDDELPTPAARGDVFAARAMTGFAAGLFHHGSPEIHARMGTRWKDADVIRVALEAGLVAYEICARDFRWSVDGARNGGTGIDEQGGCQNSKSQQAAAKPDFHRAPPALDGLRRLDNECPRRGRIEE